MLFLLIPKDFDISRKQLKSERISLIGSIETRIMFLLCSKSKGDEHGHIIGKENGKDDGREDRR